MKPSPKLLAYLQLFRLPNLFTAVADVAMGFLVVKQGIQPLPTLLLLVVVSSLLYTAGMVLNDVFDFDVDSAERPERPLPSGRISRRWAQQLGIGMLLLGTGLAWLVGMRTGLVAVLLAVAIWSYDSIAKKTMLGPLVMGSCRLLNVLLGMTATAAADEMGGFTADQWLIASGIGVYVAGVTWFARSEAKTSESRWLTFGLAIMGMGIGLLALLPWFTPLLLRDAVLVWPTLLILLMVGVVRRCAMAISVPSPIHVQQAVKLCIHTLIMLDAAVVLAVVGPLYAIGVLALLIPTSTLARWIYST